MKGSCTAGANILSIPSLCQEQIEIIFFVWLFMQLMHFCYSALGWISVKLFVDFSPVPDIQCQYNKSVIFNHTDHAIITNPITPLAVLFDFDDTLGDREAYTYQLYRHFVCDLGYDPDALETEVMVQDLMLWDQYGTAGMAYIESKLMEKYNPDLSRTGSLLDYWVNNIGQYAVLLPHAEETLRLLKEEGWILGIVTNGTAKGQSEKIEHTGIARFMDDIVISQSAGCRKPDPRIFQLSAERLHIKPQECIFVGDIWNTDMIGSRNAGMKPVWYWPHGTRVCTWPVDRISSLKELPELVRGFNHEV